MNRIIATTGSVISQKKNVTMLDPVEKDIAKDVVDVDEYTFTVKLQLTKGHPIYGQSNSLIASELTGLICLGMLSHPAWERSTTKARIDTMLTGVNHETR